MKVLKRILYAILMLIVIALITALFVKKDYSVDREITINKPKQEIFEYIKYLKNQDNFSKWARMDSAMTKTYKGTDGTVGFVSAWDSEKKDVGKGEQEITKITEGERIDFSLHFIKPMDGKANAYMSTDSTASGETRVKWHFDSRIPYPMNLVRLFMDMDKMIGDDLNVGLANLKTLMEK